MDYRRVYWLCYLGGGLLLASWAVMDYAVSGRLTAGIGAFLLVGVAVVGASAYAVAFPERAGGPTESNVRLGLAVGILLLMAFLTLSRFLRG